MGKESYDEILTATYTGQIKKIKNSAPFVPKFSLREVNESVVLPVKPIVHLQYFVLEGDSNFLDCLTCNIGHLKPNN